MPSTEITDCSTHPLQYESKSQKFLLTQIWKKVKWLDSLYLSWAGAFLGRPERWWPDLTGVWHHYKALISSGWRGLYNLTSGMPLLSSIRSHNNIRTNDSALTIHFPPTLKLFGKSKNTCIQSKFVLSAIKPGRCDGQASMTGPITILCLRIS